MLRSQLRTALRNQFPKGRPVAGLKTFQHSTRLVSSLNIGKGKANSKLFTALLTVSSLIVAGTSIALDSKLSNEAPPKPKGKISVEEFVKHDQRDDCWVVINGKVYDMTDFLSNHPGGSRVILRNAGKDATKIFEPIHPKGTIEKYLPEDKYLGELDGEAPVLEEEFDEDEEARLEFLENLPPLSKIQNLHDMEYIASKILPKAAWAYYSSGSDDEISMRENHYAYQRIYFRPRILVDMISTLASSSLEEIAAARIPGATQWYQLYVNENPDVVKKMVLNAEELGMKAIFITVDAPSLGNREKDRRMKYTGDASVQTGTRVRRSHGAASAISTFIDPSLTWERVDEIRKLTKLPIVIKGVQRVEDVILAVDKGLAGVVLSNHGGRQLDTAPPPVQLLVEVMAELKKQNKLRPDFEIFVDGGVRRSTDILKAVAIGGKNVKIGVGLGRPFLYSNSAYGEEGVRKTIQILKDEMVMSMRLLGVRNIDELDETFVDTRFLLGRSTAPDELYNQVYSPMRTIEFSNR
ncbi:hypothetical protein CANARDRAFT_203293 [[Candida] arabinofermentans NRRL YB-2248]|uniref:Cytochrome b2, mitochondrial n=1 Tax=[Candida] arabinofermentans NRRL YB-2248 TaxID=983967 RepID=A0A1E4SV28_9ASCO|nr:hypothetical protein CANARDRAFT_203293 [[Candida] arabinofermentans NRRL YB-2248]